MSDAPSSSSKQRHPPFSVLLRTVRPTPPRLPLVATVPGARLRTLIEEDRLGPEPPPGGGAPAVVLSYGRAALEPYTGRIGLSHNGLAPVALVLDGGLLENAARVLPFQSASWRADGPRPGGWQSLPPDLFDLKDLRDAPSRLVHAFYGDNFNYLSRRPVAGGAGGRRKAGPLDPYAAWLAKLDPEDEAPPSTVEVQIARPLALSLHLQAVVVPTLYLADRIITDFLISCGVACYTYSFFGGRDRLYGSLLDRLLLEYLKAQGLVHHA